MKRIMSVLAVAALMAAMMVATALPAFAAPGGHGNGCGVGFAVAPATQALGRIGKAAHDEDFNNLSNKVIQPAPEFDEDFNNLSNKVIQPAHEFVKDTCHA